MSKMLMSSVAAAALFLSGAAMAQSADHDRAGASSESKMSDTSSTSGSARASSESDRSNATSPRKHDADNDRTGSSKSMKADKDSASGNERKADKGMTTGDRDAKVDAKDAKADTKSEKSSRQAQDNPDNDRNASRTDLRKDADRGMDRKNANRTADREDRSRTREHASIDETKQNKISETIRQQHVENLDRVDFDVRVGGTIPSRYHFHRLPDQIVSIVPQYRGYDYLVANNEVVIVDPHTHKIVDTMEEGRSAAMDKSVTGCR